MLKHNTTQHATSPPNAIKPRKQKRYIITITKRNKHATIGYYKTLKEAQKVQQYLAQYFTDEPYQLIIISPVYVKPDKKLPITRSSIFCTKSNKNKYVVHQRINKCHYIYNQFTSLDDALSYVKFLNKNKWAMAYVQSKTRIIPHDTQIDITPSSHKLNYDII